MYHFCLTKTSEHKAAVDPSPAKRLNFGVVRWCVMMVCFSYKKPSSYKTASVLLSLPPSLIFPFHLFPSPVHTAGFSFSIFSGFIFIVLSRNNNTVDNFRRYLIASLCCTNSSVLRCLGNNSSRYLAGYLRQLFLAGSEK